MKDIIYPDLEVEFEKEINFCIKNQTYSFEFPFQNNSINIQNNITCTDGILKPNYQGFLYSFCWYKVIVSNCQWKGIEAYSLQFIEIKDIKLDQFLNDYLSLINQEYNKIIDLLENISLFAPEPPKVIKENTASSSLIPKSPNLVLRQTNNSQKTQLNAQKQLASYVGKNNVVITQSQVQEESIDYTVLFLLKYQLNYTYDMYLTLLVFKSLKENNLNKNIYDFNITNFLYYMVNNFTLLSKMKRFKIEIKPQIESEIQGCYELVRVCVFNLLLFIINNSNYEKEKNLEVTIKHDKFVGKGTMSYYKLTFKFIDLNPIIKYSQLNEILNKIKTKSISELDLDLIKLLDIGFLTVFYIVTTVFNSELLVLVSKDTSVTIIITFSAEPKAKSASSNDIRNLNQLNNRSKSVFPVKIFPKNQPSVLEEDAVLRILSKVFKFKPSRETNDKDQLNDSKSNDIEDSDEEDQDDDDVNENESIELDEKKFKALKDQLSLRKHPYVDFFKNQRRLTLNNLFEEGHLMKKFAKKKIENIKESSKIMFDNSIVMKNIKFCNPPRILIVEDNMYGRMNLRDNLQLIKTSMILDTAGDGLEAIEKFKFLFRQGHLFDMIFMDLNLPEIQGNEATEIIREIEKNYDNIRTKIIACTAEGKFEMDTNLFDFFCKIIIFNIIFFI